MITFLLLSAFLLQAAPQDPVPPKALESFRKGEELIGTPKESSDEQAKYFQEAVDLAPDFTEARHNLAIVYLKQKKFDQALVQLDALVRLQPANPTVYLIRADVFLAKNLPNRAVTELEQALKLNPGHVQAWEQLGNLQIEASQYEAAVVSLSKAVALPGASPETRYNLALALKAANRKKEAGDVLRQFLKDFPEDFNGRLVLGIVELELGNKPAALEHLLAAEKIQSNDPLLAEALGNLYLDLDQPEEAQKRLVRLSSGSAVNLANLGIAAKRKNQFAEAERHFRAALEKEPGNAVFLLHLGDVLAGQDRDKEAVEAYSKVLEIQPENFDAAFNLGSVYANLNQPTEAQKAFERALKINPKAGRAHLYLGIVLDRQGLGTAARNHYLQAIQTGADEAQPHFRLAVLYSREGNPTDSLKHLRIAFERDAAKYVPMIRDELKNVHSDLDAIRYLPEFNRLLAEFSK